MKKFIVSIVALITVLLLMSACSSNTPKVSPEATPVAAQTSATTNPTDEPEPSMSILLNGYSYVFTGEPAWDGKNLWLPGEELLSVMNFGNIISNDTWLTGNYTNEEGQFLNCYFKEGQFSYSPDSVNSVFIDTNAAPYSQDGRLYISEEMIEGIFGEFIIYDEASDTMEITLSDKQISPFQSGNANSFSRLPLMSADDLADTRLNALVSFCITAPSDDWMGWADNLKNDGFTSARFTLNAIDGPNVDLFYSYIEENIPNEYIEVYQYLKELGIQTRCSLSFWDMAYRQNGGTISLSRLGSEDEMERYLDYVTMVVTRLKGLVGCYELWNESDANPDFYQYITADNYTAMAQRVIPIIREIDPDAKIVFASTSSYIEEACQQYSMQLLSSDVVTLVDAISLHTVNNDASPVFHSDYYYGYDAMWDEIKATAEAHGFDGEYIADELNYRSNYSISVLQPENGPYNPYEPEVAAKYIGRMIVINRGMDISVGTSGTNSYTRPIEGTMIRNMAYLLEGLDVCEFPVTVESDCEFVRYYTFADANGSRYIAIWNDDIAGVVSSIEECQIIMQETDTTSATAYDPFISMAQALDFSTDGGDVVLNSVLLRDYPVLIKLG